MEYSEWRLIVQCKSSRSFTRTAQDRFIRLVRWHALYSDAKRTAEEVVRGGIEAAAAFNLNTGLPLICYSLPLAGSE
jgi:hypothetical protein